MNEVWIVVYDFQNADEWTVYNTKEFAIEAVKRKFEDIECAVEDGEEHDSDFIKILDESSNNTESDADVELGYIIRKNVYAKGLDSTGEGLERFTLD